MPTPNLYLVIEYYCLALMDIAFVMYKQQIRYSNQNYNLINNTKVFFSIKYIVSFFLCFSLIIFFLYK